MSKIRPLPILFGIGLLFGACGLPHYTFEKTDDPAPPGSSSCGDGQRNGAETDRDCGGSDCDPCLPGARCQVARDCAGGGCVDGICANTCPPGTAECDDDPATECESNPKTDPENCGACGRRCALAHAVSACSAGTCVVASCAPPFADCDGLPENGCEVNLSSDAEECGECGHACVALGGTPLCADSKCGIQCDAGFGDCDGNPANGCERDLAKDVKNCGRCGAVCDAGNGTPWCYDGVCGISDCPPGFGDCNANPADGCEVDLTTDAKNCKDCGTRCLAANGTAKCESSTCQVNGCKPGFDDCNSGTAGGYADGCETDVDNDADNCGSCNHACSLAHASAKCDAGQCQLSSCTPPYADCDEDGVDCEVNTETNSENCGGCGTNGLSCDAVWGARHGTGHCAAGACVFDACLPSFQDCNGNTALDGCESDLRTSTQHCGACDVACAAPHGSNSCVAGTCTPVCGTLYGDCDRDRASGCESVFATDADNCGACGAACEQTNAVNTCQGGSCTPTCASGFLSCDQNPENGCETDGRTSKVHCGACDVSCEDNHTTSNECAASVCVPKCATGYSDCDSSRANGCETFAATCGGSTGGGCSVANSVLCDDFEDGDATGWTPSGGTWSVISDGTRVYQSPLGSFSSTAQDSWGDQTIEARVKALTFGGSGSSYRVGVLARYAGGSNYYALAVDGAFDLRLLRGTSAPSGTTGTCTPLASGRTLNSWFTLKLQVSGASPVRLRSYVNGVLFHDCVTSSSTVGGGTAGLISYGSNTRAEFDDIVVTTP